MGRRGLAPVLTPVNDFITRYRWQALLLLGLIALGIVGTFVAAYFLESRGMMGAMIAAAAGWVIDIGFESHVPVPTPRRKVAQQ